MKKITPIETSPEDFCAKFMRVLDNNARGLNRRYDVENSRMSNGVAGHTGADIYLTLFEGDPTCLGTAVVNAPPETLVNILIPRELAEPIIQRCIEIEERRSQESAKNAWNKL